MPPVDGRHYAQLGRPAFDTDQNTHRSAAPSLTSEQGEVVPTLKKLPMIEWFETIGRTDVAKVGGKNASLGEMVRTLAADGIRVPPGFATSADAYWSFVDANDYRSEIAALIADWSEGRITLTETGQAVRQLILQGSWPEEIATAICQAYRELCNRAGRDDLSVAVRSSATAEDLPDASFAGQQETFLNVRGEADLLIACRRCYASLFTDRAISYRQAKGFDHMKVGLSVGVQQMVRSDLGGSGVMFSIDTETGFDKVVLINAAWGLGENVVQGAVDPDEYVVFKPLLDNPALSPIVEKTCGGKAIKMIYGKGDKPTRNVPTSKAERSALVLSEAEILELARWAVTIEKHYGCPMDMEWARDGETGEMFIVQARPETVQSRRTASTLRNFTISDKGKTVTSGIAIGDAVVSGQVCLIEDVKDIDKFVDGAVLVTSTTDPDWVPVMKRAAAIVTDHGGRTSHAAIVGRELGLPAIDGTGNATHLLHSGRGGAGAGAGGGGGGGGE